MLSHLAFLQIRPYLISDGGNVALHDIDGPIVQLKLQGACGSCPSSMTTMTMGIKRRLMEKIPVSIGLKMYIIACGGMATGSRQLDSSICILIGQDGSAVLVMMRFCAVHVTCQSSCTDWQTVVCVAASASCLHVLQPVHHSVSGIGQGLTTRACRMI